MYMREMGTVELLTREGEISIAKRIEEGLDAVRKQISVYPPTFDFLFRAYDKVKNGGGRLADVIVGFIDPNAPDVIAQPQNPTKIEASAPNESEEEESEDGDDSEEAVDTGPDPVEAAARFASLVKLNTQMLNSAAKIGMSDPKTQKLRQKLAAQFMELKLAPRMFDALIDNLRVHVNEIRRLERDIMVIAVRDAGMPRKEFIASFPRNETNERWVAKHTKAGKKWSAPLGKFAEDIRTKQTLLRESDHLVLVLPYTPESHHTIGEAELAQMKPSAILENVARGGIVDDAALARALRDRRIAGAGLDVFEGEPQLHPDLLTVPNVVLTPHIASATVRTRRAMAELAADNLIDFLLQGRPRTPLNPEVLEKRA